MLSKAGWQGSSLVCFLLNPGEKWPPEESLCRGPRGEEKKIMDPAELM